MLFDLVVEYIGICESMSNAAYLAGEVKSPWKGCFLNKLCGFLVAESVAERRSQAEEMVRELEADGKVVVKGSGWKLKVFLPNPAAAEAKGKGKGKGKAATEDPILAELYRRRRRQEKEGKGKARKAKTSNSK